jgi:MoaA/NifB/PqqE/SkfB family radical SAM enzyme
MAHGTFLSTESKLRSHPEWIRRYGKLGYNFPVSIEIDPTNRCPLACPHCTWRGLRDEFAGAQLSHEILVETIRDASAVGVRSIVWTGGGEPLLHPDLLPVLQFSSSQGLKNGMFTTAVPMMPSVSEVLVRTLSWIRFHVDGATGKTYSRAHGVGGDVFDRTVDNIACFNSLRRSRGTEVYAGIGSIAIDENLEDLSGLARLAKRLGLDYFQFKHDLTRMRDERYLSWWDQVAVPELDALERDLTDESFSLYYSAGVDYTLHAASERCHAHWLSTAVTADGRVVFCKFLRHRGYPALGNVNDASLKNILTGSRHLELHERITPRNCGVSPCTYSNANLLIDRMMGEGGSDEISSIPVAVMHGDFV